jgi:hypothetical protein
VQFVEQRALAELPRQRMLTPARADQKHFHPAESNRALACI